MSRKAKDGGGRSGLLNDLPGQPLAETSSANFLIAQGVRVCCFPGYTITGIQHAELIPRNLLSSQFLANLFSPEVCQLARSQFVGFPVECESD